MSHLGALRRARSVLARAASAAALLAPLACSVGDAKPRREIAGSARHAALPVDSFVPLDEALRRFRAGLATAPPLGLVGGAPSRDSLVSLFVRAVENRDTALANRLVLSRAEFAYLYYPTARLARPPYELDPQMMWHQLITQSEKGIARSFARLGGTSLGVLSHRCGAPPVQEGSNRIWSDCQIRRLRAPGDTAWQRLFGSIVERGGTLKFVGYSNDF